jgi:alkylhydroperoxidase/carboxymuconolactone decarboxylase family protein YurZ
MTDKLREQGRHIRARLWGDETVAVSEKFLGSFDPGFERLVNEQLFGAVWARTGIPIETRSLVTIAALIALGKAQELAIHIKGARNLGITDEAIKEVIVHVAHYAGVPAGVEAVRVFTGATGPDR